jgi:hypothetical protein
MASPPTSPPQNPEEEVAGLSVRELLEILGLHTPVQRGAIQGRVQRRLDALPPNRTHDRALLKAIQRRLLDYMRVNNLTTILLNEDLEDYTAIQDTEGQVSQNPTRFHGAPAYPQQIVAGNLNPIRRRVMTRTLLVDSSFRKQYIAGDGILACCEQPSCTPDPDCPCPPSNLDPGVPSCFYAPTPSNCLHIAGDEVLQEGEGVRNAPGPATNWALWHGEPAGRYIDAFRNQFLNCLPNAGEGVVLPCRMYEEPAANYHFDLQRSTTRILSMTLTSVQLPATSVLTVPHPDPSVYLAGPGLHNLQCVYPSAEELDCASRLDPRSTIWIIDETNGYCIHPLSIPPGHYDDTFAIAQAITTAWQRKCDLDVVGTDCSLSDKQGAFRADAVRAAYVYSPSNQDVPHAISAAHTSGHIALSVPTKHTPEPGGDPWRFSVWFVPPPMTEDGYLAVQSRGTAADDCPATQSPCYDDDVCPPTNVRGVEPQANHSFKGVAATGGEPEIPPVLPGRKPQVFKALPGSLGWVLGYRVAQLSAADFAIAPQPNPSFYPGGSFPTPDVPRSILVGSATYQASPPYLFLRINDHNNNYYAAVEGIAGESVMPPDTLAILELSSDPALGVAPNASTVLNPPLEQSNNGRYILSPHLPYKREYFGPVDVSRIHATLLDNNRNNTDLGQNNYSFTLTFETLYNL